MQMLPPRAITRSLFAPALIAVGAWWAVMPAAAATHACPRFDPPTIEVQRQSAPLTYTLSRTMEQLTRLPGRAPGPAGQSGGRVLGLAHAKYGERSQIRAMFQIQPDGTVCGGADSITVTFGFEERRVYVARELPPGTCIHREVMNHEMKHVAVDERLLDEFLPQLERRLKATVSRIGTVRGRTQEQVMASIRRPIEATLRQLLDEFTRARDRRQAQVDTAEEYKRVTTACDGELSRYMPKATTPRL